MTYSSPPFKSPLRNFGAVDMFIDVAGPGGGGTAAMARTVDLGQN